MKIELNEETRFSIGDTIYFLKTGQHGIEFKHAEVISIEIHFYKEGKNIQYITHGGYKVYDWSAWASEQEAKVQLGWQQKQ